MNKIPGLKIGRFEIKVPIIQGGMSVGISLSKLASAVANEGGIGVMGTAGIGMLEPDFNTNFLEANERALIREIRKARASTKGVLGINILIALTDYLDLIKTATEEGIDFIFLGAGLPINNLKALPEDILKKALLKIVPIVSSARALKIIFQYWAKEFGLVPCSVVVEGPLAGGHLGFKKEQIDDPAYSLEKIFPEVITEVNIFEKKFSKEIPVIAAGGIFTGMDIKKFMKMGAKGVQMATKFVATYECDASENFKEAFIKCKKEDIVIINSPVGLPGRAIKNRFLEEVFNGKKQPFECPWKCLRTCNFDKAPYCIGRALTNAKQGKIDEGFCFAGANAYRVDKIISVKELIDDLVREYEEED
ncbi:MAG: nitronate monooxygenase [Candidatus Firestonebacteria bacterium]